MPPPRVTGNQNPYGPRVTFRTLDILPPASVYVGPDDSIVLKARNNSIATTVLFSYRLLRPDGVLQPMQESFAVAGNSSVQTKIIKPSEGYLVSASATSTVGQRGILWFEAFLQRGIGSQDTTLGQVLIADYVTSLDSLGYPQSPLRSSITPPGVVGAAGPTLFAAGVDANIALGANTWWKLRSFYGKLTCSAAVATRAPSLVVSSAAGGTAFIRMPSFATVVASSVTEFTWAPGASALSVNNVQSMGFPQDFVLSQFGFIFTRTTALQAGDVWSDVTLVTEQLIVS